MGIIGRFLPCQGLLGAVIHSAGAVVDSVEEEVENDFAHGWCSLHHCEIVFEDIDVFDVSSFASPH